MLAGRSLQRAAHDSVHSCRATMFAMSLACLHFEVMLLWEAMTELLQSKFIGYIFQDKLRAHPVWVYKYDLMCTSLVELFCKHLNDVFRRVIAEQSVGYSKTENSIEHAHIQISTIKQTHPSASGSNAKICSGVITWALLAVRQFPRHGKAGKTGNARKPKRKAGKSN